MLNPMLRTVTIVLIMLIARSAFASYDDGARYAFVESAGEKSIYVIDLQEKVLADTISVQYLPSSVAASDQLKAVIVAHEADKQLTLIDLTSDTLTQIEYPLDLHPTYVAVSPLGEMVNAS